MSKQSNVIFLLVDSLNNTQIKNSPLDLMPFFNALKDKGVVCDNMYSEAPYTEAALMSLLCGQDGLQDNGYIFRFKDTKKTIFEAMQEKGYHVYTTSYEPQCHPSSVRRGLDESLYMFGYDPSALWNYRLEHYSILYNSNKLVEKDYEVLEEIVKDNLYSWQEWVEKYINNDPEVKMIKGNSKDYNAEDVLVRVKSQIASFEQDRKIYINDLLTKGKSHEFFKIPRYNQNNKIKDRAVIAYAQDRFKGVFRSIKRKVFWLNFKKIGLLLKYPIKKFVEFVKSPNRTSWKNFLKASYYSVNQLLDFDLKERINDNYDGFKDGPSARTFIDTFLSWEKEYKEEKPYFAFLHVNDVHNPETFFTYDSSDKELLNKEAEIAETLLKQIKGKYYGNITHDLSLRYFDTVIEYFYNQLKDNSILEDTMLVICADHGYSFSGNPVRDSYVVNLYLENYNIPFLMIGSSVEPNRIEKLCESKDIPATICDFVDGVIPEEFTGKSVLKNDEYDSLIIEYCGGGCPDINRRELKMAAFDREYFVGTLGQVTQNAKDILTEIYDLEKDPLQLNNLVNKKYDVDKVGILLKRINDRKEQIIKTCKM